jgi:hypothetical protein
MIFNSTTNEDTTQKTFRMPNDLIEKIEKLAIKYDRNFSRQVIFMLKEYIRFKESE